MPSSPAVIRVSKRTGSLIFTRANRQLLPGIRIAHCPPCYKDPLASFTLWQPTPSRYPPLSLSDTRTNQAPRPPANPAPAALPPTPSPARPVPPSHMDEFAFIIAPAVPDPSSDGGADDLVFVDSDRPFNFSAGCTIAVRPPPRPRARASREADYISSSPASDEQPRCALRSRAARRPCEA